MSKTRKKWSREELIIAFNLYCKIQFSKINYKNPSVIELASVLGRTPSAVAWKLANFASLDPSLAERGVKGASNTSKLDKIIFDEFTTNWEKLAYESEILLNNFFEGNEHTHNEIIFKTGELGELKEGKDTQRLVKTRINQNFFRKTVLASYDFKCCITGVNIPELLVASHIVPWSKDIENRLNPRNGLCLNNLHDKAFDRGLITFNNDFQMVLSGELKNRNAEFIDKYFVAYENHELKLPKKFLPDRQFLRFHNTNIFKG